MLTHSSKPLSQIYFQCDSIALYLALCSQNCFMTHSDSFLFNISWHSSGTQGYFLLESSCQHSEVLGSSRGSFVKLVAHFYLFTYSIIWLSGPFSEKSSRVQFWSLLQQLSSAKALLLSINAMLWNISTLPWKI